MIRRCGVVFILLFNCLPLFAAEPLFLEKIIVRKQSDLEKRYILETEYLDRSPIKSISEALSLLGIDTQARSLNYGVQTDFSYRGLSFEGLSILLNGQLINDPQTGHHNNDFPFLFDDIESIELDPLKSTINITSKPVEKSKNKLEVSAGQYQTASGRFSISEKKDDLGFRLSLERKESAGFREDTDFKILTASLFSDFQFSSQQDGFLLLGYDEKEFGAYDFYTPGLGYPSKEWTKTLILNAGLNLKNSNFLIKPGFLLRRHFDKFMLDKDQIRSSYLNHHRTDIYTGSLSLESQDGFFDYSCLNMKTNNERINSTKLGRHDRNNYELSFDVKHKLIDNLLIDNSLIFDYFDKFKERVSGSVFLKYLLDQEQNLSLGVSYKIRKPTFTELYYEDPTTRGDSSLVPEELLTYQLGYDYQKDSLSAGFSFFFRKEEKLINWVRSDPADLWQARNMLEADCFGLESNFAVRFNPLLSGNFGYAYVDKRIEDTGWLYKYGYNYAVHLVNLSFGLDLPSFFSAIELQYKKRPQRNGWFLANLSLFRNISKNTDVFLRISNLFNTEYQDIAGIPSPGRWIEAGVKLEW